MSPRDQLVEDITTWQQSAPSNDPATVWDWWRAIVTEHRRCRATSITLPELIGLWQ